MVYGSEWLETEIKFFKILNLTESVHPSHSTLPEEQDCSVSWLK